MARLEAITPATVYVPPSFSYSQAVRMGDLIFVAGQVAEDERGELVGKDDIRAQTIQVFENLRLVLDAAGSGLDLVGKVTVLTTSLAFRPAIHEIRSKVFGTVGHFPASTLAVVTSLAKPEFLIEIDAIALRRATGS